MSANKWFLPLVWATDICARALAEGHIRPQVIIIMMQSTMITMMIMVQSTMMGMMVITSSAIVNGIDLVSPDGPDSGGRDCQYSGEAHWDHQP